MEEALLLSGWEDSDGSSVWLSPPEEPEGLWLSGREEGEEGAPRPSTSPTPAPDSPFYYGKKPGEDPEPTPSPEPASGGEESGESGGEGEEPARLGRK